MTNDQDIQEKSRLEKRAPVQARGRATYERLLSATGELLGDVGVERISTNLIVERAGLTPPAFYRYFDNKYDVLRTLGERLMDAQNQLLADLVNSRTDEFRISVAELEDLLSATVEVTRAFPGGVWLTRALRAVPDLQAVRIQSHREVTGIIVAQALTMEPDLDQADTALKVRVAMDLGYAAIELVFEEPELDARAAMHEAARAIALIAPFVTTSEAE